MQGWLAANDQSKLGSQWGAGDIMYRDLNHDGVVDDGAKTVDDHGDLKVIGNSEPRFNFGLHLGADWKGIDVQMFFQGVLKRDLWLSGPMFWEPTEANGSRSVLKSTWITGDRRTPPPSSGQIRMHIIPRPTWATKATRTSLSRPDTCRTVPMSG